VGGFICQDSALSMSLVSHFVKVPLESSIVKLALVECGPSNRKGDPPEIDLYLDVQCCSGSYSSPSILDFKMPETCNKSKLE
jgi:hypothetical protein